MAPHVPTRSNWLDRWNEASADSSSVLFLDCPPFLLFPADPALVCYLQDYVPTYSSVFLPPVDPWRRFSFLASFRKIIRKPDIFAFCPIGRHNDTSPGQLTRAFYRDFRSTTTGTQLRHRRRRQGLVIRRYILGMEVEIQGDATLFRRVFKTGGARAGRDYVSNSGPTRRNKQSR
jgi:hypothetical protein